jgi:hypothetical protein
MHCQLVIQIQGDTIGGYDALVALEDQLIEALGESAEIDGHDIGSGESNIFMLTNTPEATFSLVRPVLQQCNLLDFVAVAYRSVSGEQYTSLWPAQPSNPFSVA